MFTRKTTQNSIICSLEKLTKVRLSGLNSTVPFQDQVLQLGDHDATVSSADDYTTDDSDASTVVPNGPQPTPSRPLWLENRSGRPMWEPSSDSSLPDSNIVVKWAKLF